ncbi:hypothetical protein C8R45DRAFT_1027897 [Mycena sanguinolenta]|nr:hypothetical protein C8R45DRAFT_1027897 [Mycena sanguinolenta]
MAFEALGDDVLLRIFSFCDISTVLTVSAVSTRTIDSSDTPSTHYLQVNKPIRCIALSKQLWLSLVLDAKFRAALNLPPPDREKLERLLTEELIDVVRNAVAGPGSVWDENEQTSFEVPLDDIDIAIACPLSRLLPGARYLLLWHNTQTQQRLCIYDVWGSRRIWQGPAHFRVWQVDSRWYTSNWRTFPTRGLAFSSNRVNLCYMTGDSTLHVEEVDLATSASRELFSFGFTSTVLRIEPSAIAGDFLLCSVLHSYSHFTDHKLVLVNWRASTFAVVDPNSPQVQLIPGYILSTYRESGLPNRHFPAVRALEAFSVRWQQLTEDNLAFRPIGSTPASTTTATTAPITTQALLECNGRPLVPHFVRATPDAMHTGGYNIFVHGVQYSEPPSRPVTLGQRIRNLTRMTARREKASPQRAHTLLWYKFTPSQGQASCNLRLVSAQRTANLLQSRCPRVRCALRPSNSVSVTYCQRRVPDAA